MRPAAILAVAILLLAPLLALTPGAFAQDEPVVLHVGDQAQMRTRNVLRAAIGSSGDEDWGIGVLRPVYSNLALLDATTGGLRAYITKGVDADGNGAFDRSEYGMFGKSPGLNETNVTVYFDFNGVRWHDGVQMTVMDILFTLHLASLSPRYNSGTRVLWDDAGAPSSNFTWDRWLAVEIAPKIWEDEGSLPGDMTLRGGIRFRLQAPFAPFYDSVLGQMPIFPRHVWELTGGGRHPDFGRLIYPEGHPRAGQGIPVNETLYTPFKYPAAEAWEPTDANVIGSGPFRFRYWILGVSTRIEKNGAFYTGVDPSDPGVVYDDALATSLHPPYVDAIVFDVYRTTTLGVLALKSGDIEYYRYNIPAEFVPDLLDEPTIRVWANPDPGFAYLAYNMRRAWLGYNGTGLGDAYDTGRPFRLAAAHAIDKRQCVGLCLLGYGLEGDGVVSPSNSFWHNDTVPVARYDLDAARAVLDAAHNDSLARGENWWGDADGDGWRELPGRGDAGLDILVPHADYDPRRASVGVMFAEGMRRVGLNVRACRSRSPRSPRPSSSTTSTCSSSNGGSGGTLTTSSHCSTRAGDTAA